MSAPLRTRPPAGARLRGDTVLLAGTADALLRGAASEIVATGRRLHDVSRDATAPTALQAAIAALRPDTVVLHAGLPLACLLDGVPPAHDTGPIVPRSAEAVLAAAERCGVQRLVIVTPALAFRGPRAPLRVRSQDAPTGARSAAIDALAAVEAGAQDARNVVVTVLRVGWPYGARGALALDGPVAALALAGRLAAERVPAPLVHPADAARAIAAAAGRGWGHYDIADDDPATAADWGAVLAAAIGAPLPLGAAPLRPSPRPGAPREPGALGWIPRVPSWRTGLPESLTIPPGRRG